MAVPVYNKAQNWRDIIKSVQHIHTFQWMSLIYIRQEDTAIATTAVHEQAMLTICTETLDQPMLKENTAKFMFLLISSSLHILFLQGSLPQASQPELCAGKDKHECDARRQWISVQATHYMGREERGRHNRSIESGHSGRWAWSQ